MGLCRTILRAHRVTCTIGNRRAILNEWRNEQQHGRHSKCWMLDVRTLNKNPCVHHSSLIPIRRTQGTQGARERKSSNPLDVIVYHVVLNTRTMMILHRNILIRTFESDLKIIVGPAGSWHTMSVSDVFNQLCAIHPTIWMRVALQVECSISAERRIA